MNLYFCKYKFVCQFVIISDHLKIDGLYITTKATQ